MLLKMLEHNMQIDEIIYCDTGKEFPQIYEHIKLVQDYIIQKYNKRITILKSEKSFDYYLSEHVKTRGKNKGKAGYGWATMRCRWCTSLLKKQVIDRYLSKYKAEGYIEYIGIAADELERAKDKKYPLIEWNMTEKDCLMYCYSKGFYWDGLYERFDRLSCWCCPLKNLKEYRTIYKFYPEIWKKIKIMDQKAYNQFTKNYTVKQLEDKFEEEIKAKI